MVQGHRYHAYWYNKTRSLFDGGRDQFLGMEFVSHRENIQFLNSEVFSHKEGI